MRTLITGGAGFIGSHLAEALVGQGHAVAVLDDLSTGQPGNLAAIDGHPGLTLHVGSVTDEGLVTKLVREADIVYHLAAGVGVRRVLARPVDTMATNVLGTEAVLRAAAVGGTRVVLASSSEVYGQQPRMPLGEEDALVLGAPSRPRWAYACSKALGEFLGRGYHRETGLPVVIVRYFNTIGPRQAGRYGMVVPRLVRQALDGAPLTVHGDGQQTRCFADVADAVRATIDLASAEGSAGRTFNVGATEEVNILELARRVKRLTGSQSPVTLVPYAEAYGAGFEDVRRRVPDLSRLGRPPATVPACRWTRRSSGSLPGWPAAGRAPGAGDRTGRGPRRCSRPARADRPEPPPACGPPVSPRELHLAPVAGPPAVLYTDHGEGMGGAEHSLLSLIRHLDRSRFRAVLACDEGALARAARARGWPRRSSRSPGCAGGRRPCSRSRPPPGPWPPWRPATGPASSTPTPSGPASPPPWRPGWAGAPSSGTLATSTVGGRSGGAGTRG